VRETPGARIGAMPLVGPAIRRVVAGILAEPRIRWPALGAAFNPIGYTVEPAAGGFPLVPDSAESGKHPMSGKNTCAYYLTYV